MFHWFSNIALTMIIWSFSLLVLYELYSFFEVIWFFFFNRGSTSGGLDESRFSWLHAWWSSGLLTTDHFGGRQSHLLLTFIYFSAANWYVSCCPFCCGVSLSCAVHCSFWLFFRLLTIFSVADQIGLLTIYSHEDYFVCCGPFRQLLSI